MDNVVQSQNFLRMLRQLKLDNLQSTEFCHAFTAPIHPPKALITFQTIPGAIEPLPRLPEQPSWIERVLPTQKIGNLPEHENGDFYILDYSSSLEARPLLEIPIKDPIVADFCAAPGGKSLFAFKALQPQQLICNEVTHKRIGALISNLKRCKIQNSFVVSKDTDVLAQKLKNIIDVAIVDAPCTGQSLLVKGDTNPGCFHPVNINTNKNRQRRILANALKCVRPGGFLLYSTCTYSVEENEETIEWLFKKFTGIESCEVHSLKDFRSHLSDLYTYRFWPNKDRGAGGFCTLIKKTDSDDSESGSGLFDHDVRWKFSSQS